MSLNAATTHSAIASRFFTSDDDLKAHCTVHCTVEDFNVNFASRRVQREQHAATGTRHEEHIQQRTFHLERYTLYDYKD